MKMSTAFTAALFGVSFAISLAAGAAFAQAPETRPDVIRLDPALDELVSVDAKLELVKTTV